ncbi:MAG TPA: DUF4258 domain-containing protein [Phycisphaerales bacterium]|nr:DUF4258 domain-containing protein [Phycisphaerales bacterium]
MGQLFDQIVAAAAADRVGFSDHADEMLRERKVEAWQATYGLAHGRLILERPADKPNPVAEVEQSLADGTPVKAVWGYQRSRNVALLITLHFFDR